MEKHAGDYLKPTKQQSSWSAGVEGELGSGTIKAQSLVGAISEINSGVSDNSSVLVEDVFSSDVLQLEESNNTTIPNELDEDKEESMNQEAFN